MDGPVFDLQAYHLEQRITLSHQNPFAMNAPENRNMVEIRTNSVDLEKTQENYLQFEVPAHSFEIFIFKA